jgi:hypothetical protein
MGSSQISGAYVAAFVRSAGEVSPVFEKKAKETLEDSGITDPDAESWYDNEQFGDALASIVNKAGERTVEQAGREMVKITEEIVEQDSVTAGLEVFTAQHDAIHDEPGAATAGVVTYEQQSESRYRIAVEGDGYEYPPSLTRGAAVETVRQTGGPNNLTVEAVDPSGDERFAFEVSW